VAACWLALSGCVAGHSYGESQSHEEEHVGHVIPAHKPKTFPDAVRRLRELNDRIGLDAAEGRPDAKTLQVALDIANWLPEIAADSDMPEAPWNAVNSRSAALVGDYQGVLSGAPGNTRGVLGNADVEIRNLEQLLAASDPRWFDETGKRGVAPPSGVVGVERP
jgi:hypothetical protein